MLSEATIRGEVPPPPIAQTIGMRLVARRRRRGHLELDQVAQRHANPMGTVHGGILCDVADGGDGRRLRVDAEEGETFTTLELKINFLTPRCRTGRLRARGAKLVQAAAARSCSPSARIIENETGPLSRARDLDLPWRCARMLTSGREWTTRS